MYNQIYNLIEQYDTIIIHRHEKPDGDALGSQLGLKYAILETFPTKRVFAVGEESEHLKFMGNMDIITDDIYNEALVIIVDSGAEYLISDKRYNLGKYVIKIDHHIPQGEYGNLIYVDAAYESCCGLIADFIKKTNMKINDWIATLLYTGMVTDSGRFRFQSVSSKTFESAAFLFQYHIDTDYIYNNLYTEVLSNVLLKAKMTLKFNILPCGVAYCKNTYQDVLETNLNPYALARTIVGTMSGIKEVTMWATFTELEDGRIVVELRTSKYNVNEIATKFGGGGHLQASGATVSSWDIVDQIIQEMIKKTEE